MKKIIPAALAAALCISLPLPAAALSVEQARGLLEDHYVDPLPAGVYEAATLDELFRALDDPYTVYYTAEEYAAFLSAIDGETLVGIGVSIQNAFEEGFRILSVLPDSPALEAGLRAGEVILAVDGVPLTPQDRPAAKIAGAEGTSVTLTLRGGDGQTRDVTMTRRLVQVPIVTWEQRGNAGFIDCDSFGESTATDVMQALLEMDAASAVWVMDLRENPGGTVSAAAGTAGQFLGPGKMVFFRGANGTGYTTSASRLAMDLTDKPLLILTGESSASAAELFSAAIRDHRGGIAIGARTFGKGIAQTAFDSVKYPELFEQDALKITTYRFFSPDGATNHILGVLPTLLVEEELAESVAMLLSAPRPERSLNTMKVELCGQTLYLDRDLCREQTEVFAALLEALPPDAKLFRGTGTALWREITPADAAAEYSLDYTPRTFSDVPGHGYAREINTLRTYGLLAGDENSLFHPDRTLTRGELACILAAVLDLPAGAQTFPDVSPDAWYADAVSAMAARGFLAGREDGTFDPDAAVTNLELAIVFSAVAAWCSQEGYEWSQRQVSAVQWAEFYAYPEWAQSYPRNLAQLGLDVDREHPDAAVTRGTAAGLLCQLLENTHILWNK